MKRVSLRTTAARTERQTKQTSTTTPTTSTRTSRPRQAKTQAAGSSTTLDLQSVKRDNTVPVRKKARIFGLTEAPIYYPTADEFKDPLHYIEKIRPEAEQYGIIKIVPPDTYKPPFSLNTEVFRFKTRIQKLNSMEGGTRANVNYLEQVQKFHRLFGQPLNRIPQLDKRPIDLYNLKKQVEMRGGVDMVNRHKQWAEIGRVLGYNRRECTSLSNGLKTAYTRVVQPYEEWLRQTKPKTVLAENANHDVQDEKTSDKVMCEVCRRDSDQEHLLECDDCERGYHMGCLDPPLSVPPKGEWYCYKCLVASGNDYGFEDGGEYNLAEFQRVCEDFKVKWFSQYNPVEHAIDVSEEDCENEFWRLTENPHIDCEVEYGADLHSTQHGSAFPSIERDDNKAVDPWNLNMIPILPQSLFTHIKSDISGMMVPWLYVGMCFSAFCWHNEDHFTYSINYMHWGETKTWYGIPGDDTDKFEQTMRDAVPELFEQQPNLLFQLVTMLSPGTLLKNDVRCYAVDQRPGEFVVTFPKAYHSGFNHGFNFCEAVNFAPPDWVNMGLECVQRYKEYKRHPCFSHDELLVNTYKMELTPENATWLRHALEVMVHRELNDRAAFFKKHPAAKQARQDVQGEHQCAVCHCYTYLSMVTCQCSTKKVTCFQHAMEHCSCAARNKTVIMRFTDAELRQMVTQAMQADNTEVEMENKIMATLTDPKHRECILAMIHDVAEHDGRYASDMNNLKERINAYAPTNDGAKTNIKNASTTNWHKELDALYEEAERHGLGHNGLVQLLPDLVHPVVDYQNKAETMFAKRKRVAYSLGQFDDMRAMRRALHVTHLDVDASVPDAYPHLYWYDHARQALTEPLDLDKIDACLADAKTRHLHAEQEPLVHQLQLQQEKGENWCARIARYLPDGAAMTQKSKKDASSSTRRHHQHHRHSTMSPPAYNSPMTMADLEAMEHVDPAVPSRRALVDQLHTIRTRAAEFQLQYQRTMMQTEQQQLLHRPSLDDLRELQQLAAQLPRELVSDQADQLDAHASLVHQWSLQLTRLLHPGKYKVNDAQMPAHLAALRDDIDLFLHRHASSSSSPTHANANANANANHPNNSTSGGVVTLNADAPPAASASSLSSSASSPASASSPPPAEHFCLCHRPEHGFMVNCDVCQEWYHGTCVRVTRKDVDDTQPFVCVICQPQLHAPLYDYLSAHRPTWMNLCQHMDEANVFQFVPEGYAAMKDVLLALTPYRDQLWEFCRSKPMLQPVDKHRIKTYLRDLLGLPIYMQLEVDFLVQKLNDIADAEAAAAQAAIKARPTHNNNNHHHHHPVARQLPPGAATVPSPASSRPSPTSHSPALPPLPPALTHSTSPPSILHPPPHTSAMQAAQPPPPPSSQPPHYHYGHHHATPPPLPPAHAAASARAMDTPPPPPPLNYYAYGAPPPPMKASSSLPYTSTSASPAPPHLPPQPQPPHLPAPTSSHFAASHTAPSPYSLPPLKRSAEPATHDDRANTRIKQDHPAQPSSASSPWPPAYFSRT